MSIGTLELHRFNGVEEYAVATAEIRVHDDGTTASAVLELSTAREPIRTLPDTEMLNPRPNGDVVVALPTSRLADHVGSTFETPSTYDAATERYLSRLYYVEHEGVEDNVVRLLERDGDRYLVDWTGSMTDVNHYYGGKPRTVVRVRAWFTWDGEVGPGLAESG